MTHSPLASARATIEVLRAHGLGTKRSLGQHFLVDDNIVGRILATSGLTGDEVVVEVGPGIGTLTAALCANAKAVVAIERDPRLEPVLGDTLRDCASFELIVRDALDVDPEEVSRPFGAPQALIANLPYAVAATVVLRWFERFDSVRFAVVMVQREVAERMAAHPGTKAYGSYTVKLGLRARVGDRFAVPRTCFLPPPRVDSTVVRLDRVDRGLASRHTLASARVADIAFSQRRKTLRNALSAGLPGGGEAARELLSSAGVDGGRRAETLSLDEYVVLGRNAHELGLLP